MTKTNRFSSSKHLLFSLFISFSILFVPAENVSAATSDSKRKQIEAIETELSKEKVKLEEVAIHEKGLLDQLSALDREVLEKKRTVREFRKKIQQFNNELKKLEKRLKESNRSLKKNEKQASERLVALYKYARKGYINTLATVSSLGQFWQRVKYIKSVMEEDREVLAELTQQILKNREELFRIKEKIAEKEAGNTEAKRQLLSLQKEVEKKVVILMKIHKEKEFYETAVKELELGAQDLKQTLLEIEKKTEYKATWTSDFGDLKGRLPLPVNGKVTRGQKLLGQMGNAFKKGVFIEGRRDTEVKAVFPGRIDFSGRLKGYGEIVIINHGSRFFTLSAHLSKRIKAEGDAIEKGEIIGFIGENSASERARLYFEIRKAGKSQDPLVWLKLK